MDWWEIELPSVYRAGLTTLVRCGWGVDGLDRRGVEFRISVGSDNFFVRECRCVGGPFVTLPRKLDRSSAQGSVSDFRTPPFSAGNVGGESNCYQTIGQV